MRLHAQAQGCTSRLSCSRVYLQSESPINETAASTKLDEDAEERLAQKAGDKAYQCLITLEQNNFTITIAHVFDREKIRESEVSTWL